jgi:spore coat-associated protein N
MISNNSDLAMNTQEYPLEKAGDVSPKAKKFDWIKKKRSILGMLLILVAILLIGSGTLAYFSDTETSGNNLFTTGTIDLAVNGDNPWTGTFNASLNDIKPGMLGWANVTLSNTGQNPMDVWLQIRNVETNQGTDSEPESAEALASDIDGVSRYGLIVGGSSVLSSSNYTISNGSHQLSGSTTGVKDEYIWLGNIASGNTLNVNQSFSLDSATTNWAQGDNMNFIVEFYAQQSQGTLSPPSPELSGHGRP